MALSLAELARTDFRTSKSADDINSRFQTLLGLPHRYGPARLAIGRSLAVPTDPDPSPLDDEDFGKAIKGENLFGAGADLHTWVSLVVERSRRSELSKKDFQTLVAAHWHRGVQLLWDEWKGVGNDFDRFLIHVMERVGLKAGRGSLPLRLEGAPMEAERPATLVDLRVGDPGIDIRTNEPIVWRLNGEGISPHIAVMGTLGTGKTRVAMQMVRQAREASGAAVIIFDMGKGDLAANSELVEALDAKVISSPQHTIPLNVLRMADRLDVTVSDAALRFRESFARVSRSRPGGAQLDALREAASRALREHESVSLTDVRDALRDIYAERKKADDVVVATFNDLCAYNLFAPELAPEEFFTRSWIIDVHSAPETVQRMVVFLMLDALDAYFARLKDSALDAEHNRALRLMVVVDEARKVLGYGQPSLINIVRTSRSKGGSVVLISQSPDDFAQEDENFLENIGLAVSFRTNARGSALKAVLGESVDLAGLPNGVCVTRLPDRRGVIRVKAWE
ncbi:DndE family protein [Inquilinus limosus]|uniref:type IV secretion system DNA-binding domain-containing protein n=1 Tax=Inquilinus limosus TaxID=171674 RepID=UPI003F169D53